jgi:hypothetical protein
MTRKAIAKPRKNKQPEAVSEIRQSFNTLDISHKALVKNLSTKELMRRDQGVIESKEVDGKIDLKSNLEDQSFNGLVIGEICGGGSGQWTSHLLDQVLSVGARGSSLANKAQALGAGMSFMQAQSPQNPLEAAMLAQMFAVHNLTMVTARRSETCELFDHAKVWLDQTNKLSRTYAVQVEALAKLRNGGKQTVEVKYVDARNSQNIIAETVNTGGGGGTENLSQPVAQALAYQPGAPCAKMPSQVEADRLPVQGPGDQG